MKSRKHNSLPTGFKEVATVGRYTFYQNSQGLIAWTRSDRDDFTVSLILKFIPKSDHHMFWYDRQHQIEVVKEHL